MGSKSRLECGELREILKRSHHSRIRDRDLEGGTMPHTLEKKSVPETSAISPLAGKRAPKELLIDPDRLQRDYYGRKPDVNDRNQLVAFGTSGHRGSALR